ncbi:unnamed protein product [Rotaria sordida]|uniref:Uncharacterized protein n=1 Tax=Rotaria sordida TaxID=392033 RepID=A0A815YI76_9BILA|nr:unnamed protein product [Rotaria sordida]CAF1571038.1 unnamed protein product [Rotaria sordida]
MQSLQNQTKAITDQKLIQELAAATSVFFKDENQNRDIHNNTIFTTINLQGNRIRAIGAQHIGDALKNNKTITILNLRHNHIADEGTQHLSDALKKNSTLTTLNLRYNQIGEEGAKYLADALKNNTVIFIPL